MTISKPIPTSSRASAPPTRETVITSSENAVYRALNDSLTPKGIRKHEMFLIFGERAVRDTLINHASLVRDIIICQGTADDIASPVRAFVNNARKAAPSAAVLNLSKALFKELDIFGTHSPILALRTPEIPEIDLSIAPQGLEILCALSDPSNLGALLRSATAFSASRVILLKECASPFHPKAIRAASAATLAIGLARGPSIKDIESHFESNDGKITGTQIVALDMRGTPLTQFKWPKNVRLLLGEEGQGVPTERPGLTYLAIPMAHGIESLNATVAASIAMYAYRAQN